MAAPDKLLFFFSSYLGVNPAIGCSNGCGYCILEKDTPNPAQVWKRETAKHTLDTLLKTDKVSKTSPVAFYNLSDPFLKKNVADLMYMLEGMNSAGQKNLAVIITKLDPDRTAPDENALERIAKLKNIRPVMMISYANLPKQVEPVSKTDRLNLMGKAKKLGIPVVQYARPVWEKWTPKDKIREMVDETANLVDAVVLGGVVTTPEIKKKLETRGVPVPPWDNDKGRYLDNKYRSFVIDAYHAKNPDLGVFNNSSCGISAAAKVPNYMGYYWHFSGMDSEGRCQRPCQKNQREKCSGAVPSIRLYDESDIADIGKKAQIRLKRKEEETKIVEWQKRFDIKRAMFHVGDGTLTMFANMTGEEVRWMRQHTGMYIYFANHFGRVGYRPGVKEFLMYSGR